MVSEYVRTLPHGVEYFRTCFCELVRFHFAAVVIDVKAFEPEIIHVTLVSSDRIELYMYMYVAGSL